MSIFGRRQEAADSKPVRGKTSAESNSGSFTRKGLSVARGADGKSELTLSSESAVLDLQRRAMVDCVQVTAKLAKLDSMFVEKTRHGDASAIELHAYADMSETLASEGEGLHRIVVALDPKPEMMTRFEQFLDKTRSDAYLRRNDPVSGNKGDAIRGPLRRQEDRVYQASLAVAARPRNGRLYRMYRSEVGLQRTISTIADQVERTRRAAIADTRPEAPAPRESGSPVSAGKTTRRVTPPTSGAAPVAPARRTPRRVNPPVDTRPEAPAPRD